MTKTLFMLIGPKGSGKTHIGDLVGQHTGIHFLRVETIWLTVQPGEDGWQKVEQAIDEAFKTYEQVMVESLGAGEGFKGMHASLSTKYEIKMINVVADLKTCLARVKSRDNKEHIAVSDDQVKAYNLVAAAIKYDWALEIINDPPVGNQVILNAIGTIN